MALRSCFANTGSLAHLAVAAAAVGTLAVAAPVFPTMPSFKASTSQADISRPGGGGVAKPWFVSINIAYIAETHAFDWRMTNDIFSFVAPAYENLETRTLCYGANCTTRDRNGTICYDGVSANIAPLLKMWALLPEKGTNLGSSVVEEQDCEVWHFSEAQVGSLTMCVGGDGVPLSIVSRPAAALVGESNTVSYSQNMTLTDIRVGDVAASPFEPLVCPREAPRACAEKGVASKQIIRFSNGEPWGHLEDRDTCDWDSLGVTGGFPDNWRFMRSKYLEVFDVDLDESYGPWRECDWNAQLEKSVCSPVYSPDLQALVARTSSELLTGTDGLHGQCAANDLVGSWYVFPHEGACGENATVGEDGCTWKLSSFRVVTLDCIKEHASELLPLYKADYQKAPFPQLVTAFRHVVEECPDVSAFLV